jgi:hypothetical protein
MQAESQMYEPLVSFFRAMGMYTLREVTTHQGRVDVLAARLDPAAVSERIAREMDAMTSPALLRAWRALPPPSRACSLASWAHHLGVQPSSLRRHARVLEDFGVIVVEDGRYARCTPWPRLVVEVACCEAKLDDWQRGLRQAFGHRFYANRTYLALARVPRGVDQDLLTTRRVGLINVSHNGVQEAKRAPRLEPWDELAMLQIEEQLWFHITRNRARVEAALATTATSRPTA